MERFAVKAKRLKKLYATGAEEIVALKEIDVEIKNGEFVAIMGPSGAGKSTFLNLVGHLDIPTSGDLNVVTNNIGFVFEEFLLISSLNALENVQLPLIFAGNYRNNNRPEELLERVGLANRLTHLPKELSGGELQRVAVARALVNSPRLILADEPTGNLDTKNAQGLFNLFRQLHKEGLTVIVATHNTKLGYQTDRVIHLSDGKITKDEKLVK